jgi:hypothetical protein
VAGGMKKFVIQKIFLMKGSFMMSGLTIVTANVRRWIEAKFGQLGDYQTGL